MKITFAKIEDNAKMYGSDQVGVYLDGVMRFFITSNGGFLHARIFTYPDNQQMCGFINKYKPSSVEEMKKLVQAHLGELLETLNDERSYFIKSVYTSGVYGSVSREHLSWGYLSFDAFDWTREQFSLELVQKLKALIHEHPEKAQDVTRIEIIDVRELTKEIIQIKV